MTRHLGIGIVGYGAIARVHATALAMFAQMYPDMGVTPTIVAITPGGPASVARATRDYPHVPHVTYAQLLERDEVDVVLCATPTQLHGDYVRDALVAGKHVMCEKPLTVDVAQSRTLVDLAETHQRVLAVNHHFRHVPALCEMQRRIASGGLGTPIGGHLRYYRSSNVNPQRPTTWRFEGPGAGVLIDLGSHLIDLVHFLSASTIVRVLASMRTVVAQRPNQQGRIIDIHSDDVAWLGMHLANGMYITLEASKMVPGAADDVRVELYGTQSSMMFDMLDVNAVVIGDADAPAATQRIQTWNRMSPPAALPSPETSTGSLSWHAASWQQCVARIIGQQTPLCDGRAGLMVDAVLRAAQLSATAGGVWVEVSYE
ncbi:MAG: Gfo/Idh/MocA family oxidoreductase [Chloroflexi bacterium]|nr:Gfo/Idh/MocA family oxidoreductase [Chloroflexota bacterium]